MNKLVFVMYHYEGTQYTTLEYDGTADEAFEEYKKGWKETVEYNIKRSKILSEARKECLENNKLNENYLNLCAEHPHLTNVKVGDYLIVLYDPEDIEVLTMEDFFAYNLANLVDSETKIVYL